MTEVPRPRVRVPPTARKGDIVEIKATISHDMESGQRKDKNGKLVPRMILKKFVCTYNGVEVFSTDWYPAISANPYLAFHTRAVESGTLVFTWTDDNGAIFTTSQTIRVEE